MKVIFTFIALVIMATIMTMWSNQAKAGGPWSDQYCDIETTQIRVVDQSGNVIEERVEEKVTCEDGVKDFLHGMGIAGNCKFFTWDMPYQNTVITQRSIACERLDGGGYEIVPGYHSIN
jgi:hypothetical protein